jgi:hypothetical protein
LIANRLVGNKSATRKATKSYIIDIGRELDCAGQKSAVLKEASVQTFNAGNHPQK